MSEHPGAHRPPFGIDALLADPRRYLPGPKVALLTNQAALTADGMPTLEALRLHPDIELVALLTPEHGFSGFEDDATPIEDRRDKRTGLRQYSLYGPRRRPDPAVLAAVDAVVIDVQDVGVRCYTYATTATLVCEAAAESGTRVVICDRPNPLGPRMDGPLLEPALRSFLGYVDVPYRHGLTIGEVVRWGTRQLAVDLLVAPATPGVDLLGSPYFVPPSPGLPTRESVALYPGLVLLEGVNLNEGRGTTLPFELIGAPWLDGYELAAELNELGLPGLFFRPLTYLPRSDEYAGEVCHGVQLHVTDRHALRPLASVATILRHVRSSYPDEFRWVQAADKPWSSLPGAGHPWHEPIEGLLIDSLTGSTAVRHAIDGDFPIEMSSAAWSVATTGWQDSYERLAGAGTRIDIPRT